MTGRGERIGRVFCVFVFCNVFYILCVVCYQVLIIFFRLGLVKDGACPVCVLVSCVLSYVPSILRHGLVRERTCSVSCLSKKWLFIDKIKIRNTD